MSEEQRRKIQNRIKYLSGGIMVVLILAMIGIGLLRKVETMIFPIVIGVGLAAFWVVSDVLAVKWLNAFADKTDGQKRSYYVYAGLDLIGLGGLVYFIVDMKGMTGALIYICCLFLKRRFQDEFQGTEGNEEAAENQEPEGSGESAEKDADE